MFRFRRSYKTIVLLIIVMLLPLTAGCWDRRELNKRAIVIGLGLDSSSGQNGSILVTAQVIDPTNARTPQTGGGGGGEPFWNISSEGTTLLDAIRAMTHISSRKPFLPHNQVIVFGEDLAKKGIKDYLDMLARDYEFRQTNWILVCEGKAQDILSVKTRINSVPALFIRNMIEERGSSSQYAVINLKDLIGRIKTKSTAPIASYIRIEKFGQEKRLHLCETAVFDHDMKMLGILNAHESRGLLWVLGQVKSGIINVKKTGMEGSYSLEILGASSKIIPGFENGEPVITVQIKERSNLGESSYAEDLNKPEPWKQMVTLQNQAIRQEMFAALEKAQALNADIFGFGEAFHQKYPKEWKEMISVWPQIFPTLKVHIVVESKVERPGIIINNVFTEKGD